MPQRFSNQKHLPWSLRVLRPKFGTLFHLPCLDPVRRSQRFGEASCMLADHIPWDCEQPKILSNDLEQHPNAVQTLPAKPQASSLPKRHCWHIGHFHNAPSPRTLVTAYKSRSPLTKYRIETTMMVHPSKVSPSLPRFCLVACGSEAQCDWELFNAFTPGKLRSA
ncbi:hypothetical protein K461DRAFT_163143 [Myriangium duriaei CBS 260.36]|uniref:Uncharacterized protein n=1 Tax=Myriangium duriaei CBS 260.36 TaxID=1168546 RepID=A0A9P4MFB3_9PEZI|nr:hypothetical protein K461DRAFT_163143 [Myriangium duriaei CBS 260.36]